MEMVMLSSMPLLGHHLLEEVSAIQTHKYNGHEAILL